MAEDNAALSQLSREVPRSLGQNARLFGIDHAVPVRFYGKQALWIPAAVSDNPGGRETIYELPIGESTLMGVYAVGTQLVKEMVTRTANRSYSLRLESQGGKEIFSGEGELESVDERIGYGMIHFHGERTQWAKTLLDIEPGRDNKTNVWVAWSFIKVDHE